MIEHPDGSHSEFPLHGGTPPATLSEAVYRLTGLDNFPLQVCSLFRVPGQSSRHQLDRFELAQLRHELVI